MIPEIFLEIKLIVFTMSFNASSRAAVQYVYFQDRTKITVMKYNLRTYKFCSI